MTPRLKVFTRSDGFYFHPVAVSSQVNALARLWADQDLFKSGYAREVTSGLDDEPRWPRRTRSATIDYPARTIDRYGPKAIPVILKTAKERDVGMRANWNEARATAAIA